MSSMYVFFFFKLRCNRGGFSPASSYWWILQLQLLPPLSAAARPMSRKHTKVDGKIMVAPLVTDGAPCCKKTSSLGLIISRLSSRDFKPSVAVCVRVRVVSCVDGCVDVPLTASKGPSLTKRLSDSEPRETPKNAALAVKHIPRKPFKASADGPFTAPPRVQLVKPPPSPSARWRWLITEPCFASAELYKSFSF